MEQKERLIEILSRYFQIGDSYAYNLTRDKEAFSVGTMDLDDFEEFDEVTVADIAEYLTANGVIVPPCKVGDTVYSIEKMCLDCIHFTDGGYSDYCECTLDDDKSMFECDFDKQCVYQIYPKKFTYGMIEYFGKTVFLTRELAEEKLNEQKKL